MAYSTEHYTNTNSTHKFHLIWLADNIEELKRNNHQSFVHLRNIDSSMDSFSDVNLFVNYIFENIQEKILMIVTGELGENTLPIIHDVSQLDSVFVFCRNKTRHQQWAKNWAKVKGVFNKMDEMCQAIEQVTQSPPVLPTSSPIVRRAVTSESPQRTTAVDNQRLELDERRHRRRGRSPVPTQTEVDTTASNPSRRETDVQKETTIIDRLRDRDSSSSPLINSRKPSTAERQSPSDVDELQRTIIATTEQALRKSMLWDNYIHPTPSIDTKTIDRLQDTITQTIEKHTTKKKDDSNVLNLLFADLKQVLVDAIVQQQQQQPIVPQELIKQTVLDVLSNHNNLRARSSTTTELTGHRKPITTATIDEVKISANLKLTRVDATFRQERDAVVANKRLRAAVQQWSSVGSMADLVTTIKTYGKTNLECAWLLFCWIGQNIQYQAYCNHNSAETVFRTRKGVCRGFVSLYHECCSLLNIECSEISGYAKQAFLKPGEKLTQSPHAWNSIVLDQYTYLIDPTWGAGGRDNDNKLEDFYFLTSPEELIYTHYCNGYQLLEPEISRDDFLRLPVMKSTYYKLGLTLLSPKQGFNETQENLFKIAIRAPENVDLFIQLKINDTEYPRTLHTFCQRDETQSDVYNCYVAPPVTGLYEVAIYARTNNETHYRDAINMRLRVLNIVDAFTFPLIYSSFTENKCLLIEPLQRLVYQNEDVLIHMIIPHANVIKIQNGDDYIVPGKDEYKRGVLRKKVRVQGDLQICARWDDNADTISIVCVFNML